MKRVLLIGAGQIGSRHLQAIKMVESTELEITVYDPSPSSLVLCLERWEQVAKHVNHQISFVNEKSAVLGEDFDIVVVATNSSSRESAVRWVLDNYKVAYMILEKVLFNQVSAYERVEKLLKEKNVKAWVNCPTRIQEFERKIKSYFGVTSVWRASVEGTDYGLACNAIHFLDYFCYLTGESEFSVNLDHLDDELVASKRSGFFEVYGTVLITFNSGHNLTLTCHKDASVPLTFILENENKKIVIERTSGKASVFDKNENTVATVESYTFQPQSKLTNIILENLFASGECQLTSFNESSNLHLKLYKPLRDFASNHIEIDSDDIPFT